MLKWTYLAAAAGWAVSMVYEWMWDSSGAGGYLTWGVIVVTVLVGLFIRQLTRRRNRPDWPPMLWFLWAAIIFALFYAALERTVQGGLSHIPLLPLYIVLFGYFFVAGCHSGWKKLKKRNSGGEPGKWPWK